MSVRDDSYTEALFAGIFASSLDAIITIDGQGIIEMFNPAAEKLFGYEANEVIGKNIKLLMPDPYCKEHDGYLQHYKETGQSHIIGVGRDLLARKKNGVIFPMHLSVNEAKLKDRQLYVGFIRDISSYKQLEEDLSSQTKTFKTQIWLRDMQINLHKVFRGEKQRDALCGDILASIVEMTRSDVGVFYFMENDELYFISGHAYPASRAKNKTLAIGEGLSGLAAATNKIQLMTDLNDSDLVLESSIETMRLKVVMAVPLPYEGKILGVIEIGAKDSFLADTQEFMDQVREAIAISLNMVLSREKIKHLFEQTQAQTEELSKQAASLVAKNAELAEQAKELQTRQEEIEQNNEELEEQRAALEEQTKQLEESNADLELTRENLEKKTQDLENSSRYKSEFLANVSHELRTPLNSILVLSQLFMENKKQNLDANQLESAQTIYGCGNDLLSLINDILDLSKVEANRMDLNLKEISTDELLENLHSIFAPLASEKGLEIKMQKDKDFPVHFISDQLRLEQILRNFLSNAVKFTDSGVVEVSCSVKDYDKSLVFAVKDTGIGIAKEHLEDIFVAFQQIDGGSDRKYGGTGLGLAIASKISQLLDGKIKVQSKLGKGSTFALYLPYIDDASIELIEPAKPLRKKAFRDDREELDPKQKTLLIVEDDYDFLDILIKFAKQQKFQVLVATTGSDALQTAQDYLPDGIILDIRLPEMDGISVLKALKEEDSTRSIPVHVITATSCKDEVLSLGAISFLQKPVNKQELQAVYRDLIKETSQHTSQILLLEDDLDEQKYVKSIFKGYPVKIKCFKTVAKAFAFIQKNSVDGIILDADLHTASGFELLDLIQLDNKLQRPPVIIYTNNDLSKKDARKYADLYHAVVRKAANSDERLLQEAHNFLQKLDVTHSQKYSRGKDKHTFNLPMIMLVDDDERNLFALKKLLESLDVLLVTATNGKEAVELYTEYPNIALILMDMMLPVMSGYEATKIIRHKNASVPIIAITAKAMPEDRQECLDAGCTDYLAKPIDTKQLLSLVKIWLK